jgi:uncharacterized protein YqiB (DUF1249 family)
MNTGILDNDSFCAATWRSRPGDFVSLMTLYESNFIRLRSLVDDVFALPDTQISECAGDCPLHLQVVERSPYTVTLTMTYEFTEEGVTISDPDLHLRVYRDARLAEALGTPRWRRHVALSEWRSRIAKHIDVRWQRNMMLNKWLEYCADRGHRFVTNVRSAG